MRPIAKHLGVRDYRSIAGGRVTLTAGGGGDNAAAVLSWVDRLPADMGPFHHGKLIIGFRATLAADATLTILAQVRDATSSGGANAGSVGSAVDFGVVATGGSGGTTEIGTVEIDVDFLSFREFVGVTVTPNLSAANTDTAELWATWLVGGANRGGISRAAATIGGP